MSQLSIAALLRHPSTALKFLRKHPGLILIMFSRRNMIGVEKSHIALHLANNHTQTYSSLKAALQEDKPFSCFWGELLYRLVRYVKPRVVIETGVYLGASSAFILQALERNGDGALYSIDLPDYSPRGVTVGHHVPEVLKNNWNLILESSETSLPKLLARFDKIDIFIHDSLHSREIMIFEYLTAWSKIVSGGLLISDDIDMNDAYSDFLNSHGNEIKEHYEISYAEKHFGIIVKS